MTDIQSLVRGVYKAYETKDRAAIEALLADDFHFTSPLDNRLDRATYFKVCWPNSESVQRFDLVNSRGTAQFPDSAARPDRVI